MTTYHHVNYHQAALDMVKRLGNNIVIGIPLGLGKPVGLINALYQLAENDPSLSLTIITGLTLAIPTLTHDLEKRLAGPILDRLYQHCEILLYEKARELNTLPDNINVIEFFLSPGKFIKNKYVQQHYVSSKYTSVTEDALYYHINLYAQEVSVVENEHGYSLSCNTDLFYEIINQLPTKNYRYAIVGVVNKNLPIMYNDALVKENVFTDLIDVNCYPDLFSVPLQPISQEEHLIGLYTSLLIRDNSCLQLGIGKMSNAIANALILRHQNNSIYSQLINHLNVFEKWGENIINVGESGVFNHGLYASTEMLSDEYLQLYKANILKKRVYDHAKLQRLINKGLIDEKISPHTLDILLEEKMIHPILTKQDLNFLKKFGIFRDGITLQQTNLVLNDGTVISANLTNKEAKTKILSLCLGNTLTTGKFIHAAFFLGSRQFYNTLKTLPLDVLKAIDMTSIARTNQLFWSHTLLTLQRQQARFVNSAMMITLGGEIVADCLADFQEVSGIGGQFDFINMAHDLANARSIITCRSTRTTKKGTFSNIIWNYPSISIPRYLRDIVITEYGIADCRSKTDSEVIKALLNITDSRFQPALLQQAKRAHKLPEDYVIPVAFQANYPETIATILKPFIKQGYCQPYPFGSDLTPVEIRLEQALLFLNQCHWFTLICLIIRSSFLKKIAINDPYLERMQLLRPKSIKEWVYRKLLLSVLNMDSRSG